MKFRILIIVGFIFNICNGQQYEFDKVVNNKFSTEHFPNQVHTNVFNSNDNSYHMQIYRQNDTLKARIFDTKVNKTHMFYVVGTDSLVMKYNKTLDFENTLKNQPYEFSDATTVNGKTFINLTILNIRKRRIALYKLTIKKEDHDYFPFFKFSGGIHPYEFSDITAPFNFKVIKSEGSSRSGSDSEYILDSIKDVNISVFVPLQSP